MFRPKKNAAAVGRIPSARVLIVACAVACGWSCPILAGTPVAWHADIDAAHAASRTSQRPVLAIFSATWSEAGTRVESETLTDAGVAALLSGCFEPVLVDVDQHPGLTRRLKIAHIPTAAIMGEDESPLATFECPESPTAFVAACGRAAQQAARREATRQTAAAERQPATDPILRAAVAERSPASTRIADATVTTDVGNTDARGSADVVAAKVRHLANFADIEAKDANPTLLVTSTETSRLPPLESVASPVRTAATPTSVWPAQQAAAPVPAMASQPAAAAAPASAWPARQSSQPLPTSIEPQSTTQSAATTGQPWLGAPASPAPLAAAAPQAAAVAQLPASAPQQLPSQPPPTPAPATPPKSAAQDMLAALKNPFGMFSRPSPAVTPPPTLPPTLPPVRPQSPVGVTSTTQIPDTYGSMPLGLEGYCPVTLAQKGAWTEGRAQYGARHRGRTYLFAGPEQQQAFLADPDRYAPALSGDDPVLAFESGKTAPGQRRYGVTYQSRMYLFSTPETRTAFAANPERYTTQVKLAEQPAPLAPGTRRF